MKGNSPVVMSVNDLNFTHFIIKPPLACSQSRGILFLSLESLSMAVLVPRHLC